MRSSVSLLAVALAIVPAAAWSQTGAPPELAGSTGPSATAGNGAEGYDRVGSAIRAGEVRGIAAAHPTLAVGSIAEVTALDTGRTILVRIAARGPTAADIALSPAAADLLGLGERGAVRVRAVAASAPDAAALARGEPAAPRIDAPPALLAALRRQLAPATAGRALTPASLPHKQPLKPGAPYARPDPPAARPVPRPPAQPAPAPKPVPQVSGGLVVQVAAFADQARARAAARTLGGSVQPAGALWRVRLGPYRDRAAAQRARDDAARRGYAGAQIIPNP